MAPPRALTPLDLTAALAVVVLWAFNFIAGKVGVQQFPPLFLIALRFGLVALLLAPCLRQPLGRRIRRVMVLSVVFGCCHFGLLFFGLSGVDAGPAAIAAQLTVPFSALLAFLVYRERLGRWQILGMLVAFSGVYLLAGASAEPLSTPHLLAVVGGALAWSVSNLLIKDLGPMNAFQLNAWIAALAAPQLLGWSLILETGQGQALAGASWLGWAAIAYMAVGASITAYGLWYHLVEKYEVNQVVPLTLLAPVLAVLLSALLLGEVLSPPILIGGALTISGVAMIQFLGARRAGPRGRG